MKHGRIRSTGKHILEWFGNIPRNGNALRRLALMVVLLPLLWLTLANAWVPATTSTAMSAPAMTAILADFEGQTGAKNAVAAVYLNYRLFDTLLETLLLVVSATGIVYFLEEKGRETTDKPA